MAGNELASQTVFSIARASLRVYMYHNCRRGESSRLESTNHAWLTGGRGSRPTVSNGMLLACVSFAWHGLATPLGWCGPGEG